VGEQVYVVINRSMDMVVGTEVLQQARAMRLMVTSAIRSWP